MKYFLLAGILFLTCTTCATRHQTEERRESVVSGVASFNYKWEEVYDAILYVIMHSEQDPVKRRRRETTTLDFVREVRTIYWSSGRHVDLTICFILDGPAITKIEFLLPHHTPPNIPEQIVDESKYLVENGVEAYNEKYAVEEQRPNNLQEDTAPPLGLHF